MSRKIKISEYHNDPITILEFPDGVTWTVRQPLEADFYRTQDVVKEHQKRVTKYGKKLAENAAALTSTDEDARVVIDENADEERLPIEVTIRFMQASILAVFIEPKQSPEKVLEMLGPGIINELQEEVNQLLSGEAAKKKLAQYKS
jgi:hypothetical protein